MSVRYRYGRQNLCAEPRQLREAMVDAPLAIPIRVSLCRWRAPEGRNGRLHPHAPFEDEVIEECCDTKGEALAMAIDWLACDGEEGWSHEVWLSLDNQGGG